MRYWMLMLALLFLATNTVATSSGYHLSYIDTQKMPRKIRIISFPCDNPHRDLKQAICTELRLHNIEPLIENRTKNQETPSLWILNLSENQITNSMAHKNITAEYQITLSIHAKILISEKKYYPVYMKVHHSFFDNSVNILATDDKKDIIRQELYQKAAQKLVNQFIYFTSHNKRNESILKN